MHLLLGDCQVTGVIFVLNNRTVKSELEKFHDKWVENYGPITLCWSRLSSIRDVVGAKNRRLLLCHAVNRSQARDDFNAAKALDFPAGKKILQDAERLLITGIVEYRC
jgi:hypothetical protein